MQQSRGFTIIELLVVVLLLGIVGAVVIPRFLEPSAFDEAGTQDGIITAVRAAQQAALGRSNVTFRIGSNANQWQLVTRAGVGNEVIRSIEITKTGISLETGSSAPSPDGCATAPGDFDTAVAPDFLLTFDGKGDLATFTNGGTVEPMGALFNGVRICVNDTVQWSVCVSPAGYAYAGDCDE